MRLEFRAFDGKRYLHHISKISFDTNGNIYKVEGYYKDDTNYSKLITLIKPVIEQYTGIKDKNGVKIFEGDIVQSKVESFMSFINEITFFDGSFRLNKYFCEDNTLTNKQFINKHCEIIGNKHQNPELLEQGE